MTPTLISQGQIPSGPNTLQPHYRSLVDSSQRPLPPVPRIAEEDECPICHRELPSRTLPDFEKLRENHIQSCIEEQLAANSGPSHRSGTNGSRPHSMGPQEDISQLSSSHPTNPTIYPAASPSYNASNVGRRRGVSNAIPQASSSAATLPGTPESRSAARERAHAAVVLGASRSPQNRGRRSGVFPYKATEKDCIDDAECTICMEEYEVGEEMGRLECFCRYHLRCIQGWFETHPGQCPVHGMDG